MSKLIIVHHKNKLSNLYLIYVNIIIINSIFKKKDIKSNGCYLRNVFSECP